MPDLRTQLRGYVDAMYAPVTADEVMERGAHPRRSARRVALLVGALAVTASLLGLLVLTITRDDATTRVSTGASRPRSPGTWEQVPGADTGLDPGAQIAAVVTLPGTLIAVGSIVHFPTNAPGDLPFQAAIWTSGDGRTWSRSGVLFGTGRFTTALVMRGTVFAIASPQNGGSASVWSSGDGLHWELVTDAAPDGILMAVVHAGRIVAGGADTSNCGHRSTCVQPAIWTSGNGRTWVAERRIGGVRSGYITALSATRDAIVAVGTRLPGQVGFGAKVQPVAWTSTNGRRWRVVDDGLGRNSYVSSALGNRGTHFLALGIHKSRANTATTTTTATTMTTTRPRGSSGFATVRLCAVLSGSPTAWASASWETWHQFDPRGLEPESSLSALQAAHSWWFAAGSHGDCNQTRAVVFMSRDGRRWSPAIADATGPSDSGMIRYAGAMAATQTGLIVFVSSSAGDGTTAPPDVWIWSAGR